MAKLEARYRTAADRKAGRISGYAGVWYDPCRRPARKYVTLRTADEATARRRLAALEKKEALGVWHPWEDTAPENGVTVNDAIERYLKHQRAAGRAESTVEAAERLLKAFEADLPAGILVQHVETRHVVGFINAPKRRRKGESPKKPSKREPKSAATKKRYRAVLQHFGAWAMKKGLCAANFAAGVETAPVAANRRDHLTEAEEAALLRSIEAAEVVAERSYAWLKDWLTFGTRTGLRPGEQHKLRWSAVRPAEATVRVGKGYRTKTAGSTRTVPLPAAALDALRHRAEARTGEGDGPVFTLPGGGAVELQYLSKRLQHFAEEAELGKNVTAYSLRHSYGTRLALAGTPLFIIARLMGTSVAMVERHYAAYSPEAGAAHVTRVFDAATAEAVEAVEALDRGEGPAMSHRATSVQQNTEWRRTAADIETALAG